MSGRVRAASAAESADAEPGADLVRGYAELDRLATAALAAWTAYRSGPLARLGPLPAATAPGDTRP